MAAGGVQVLRDLLPDDLDSTLLIDVGISRIVEQCPVRLARVWRQERTMPLRGAVEAPDGLDRPVPELEQPLAVLVLHLLADVERRRSAGVIVDPRRRPPDVVQETAGGTVRGGREGQFPREVPGDDRRADGDRDPGRTLAKEARHE